jgi:3-oxoacyl-[acyl-carrier protein] reductase
MSTSLAGKTALVTGAGRGIGRAIAMGLAGAGGTVALVARSAGELAETARRVHELGGTPLMIGADFGDPGQFARIAQRARDEMGIVDILLNNAGVMWPLGPSVSAGPDEWAAAIAINVVAVANLTLALLPAMPGPKWGRIVNVSSGVVASPAPGIGGNAYVTGKAALEAHTLNRAAELSPPSSGPSK